jgi:hypothetical protein
MPTRITTSILAIIVVVTEVKAEPPKRPLVRPWPQQDHVAEVIIIQPGNDHYSAATRDNRPEPAGDGPRFTLLFTSKNNNPTLIADGDWDTRGPGQKPCVLKQIKDATKDLGDDFVISQNTKRDGSGDRVGDDCKWTPAVPKQQMGVRVSSYQNGTEADAVMAGDNRFEVFISFDSRNIHSGHYTLSLEVSPKDHQWQPLDKDFTDVDGALLTRPIPPASVCKHAFHFFLSANLRQNDDKYVLHAVLKPDSTRASEGPYYSIDVTVPAPNP